MPQRGRLRAWRVAVVKIDQSHGSYVCDVHYVVARSRRSAVRQAKTLSGYTGRALDHEGRLSRIDVLEDLDD